MNGLILINKDRNITSHDIVLDLRKIFAPQKIGHFGTLDLLARGLLVVALGRATKFFPFFSKMDKVYEGCIRLGFSTDSYDTEGQPTSPENKSYPAAETVRKAMKSFEGEIEQFPPLFSAKKFKGKPLYKLARRKKEIKLSSFRVFIHFFTLKNYAPPFLDFEAKCSSGTYIRSLAHDLGQILGCGAHLSDLVRKEVGCFKITESFSVREIKQLYAQKRIKDFLISLESLLPQFPKVLLGRSGLSLVQQGNTILAEHILRIHPPEIFNDSLPQEQNKVFRLFDHRGKLLALARPGPQPDSLSPFLVIH